MTSKIFIMAAACGQTDAAESAIMSSSPSCTDSDSPAPKVKPGPRRFSRGDGVEHAVHGKGHVWQGAWLNPAIGQWMCQIIFEGQENEVFLSHQQIPESELVSLPGTGQVKYGQGKAGCRVGLSRYGERAVEREIVSNGRTVIRTLDKRHN